jgi:hypothetical protein
VSLANKANTKTLKARMIAFSAKQANSQANSAVNNATNVNQAPTVPRPASPSLNATPASPAPTHLSVVNLPATLAKPAALLSPMVKSTVPNAPTANSPAQHLKQAVNPVTQANSLTPQQAKSNAKTVPLADSPLNVAVARAKNALAVQLAQQLAQLNVKIAPLARTVSLELH